jgi:hypothetical protein
MTSAWPSSSEPQPPGGVAAAGQSGSGRNQLGDPLWLKADPATYHH